MDTFKDKNPLEKKPFSIDWTKSLATGEKVTLSTWTITGPDNALISSLSAISLDGKLTQVTLEGGTLEGQYSLLNYVETDSAPVRKLTDVKLVNIRYKTN